MNKVKLILYLSCITYIPPNSASLPTLSCFFFSKITGFSIPTQEIYSRSTNCLQDEPPISLLPPVPRPPSREPEPVYRFPGGSGPPVYRDGVLQQRQSQRHHPQRGLQARLGLQALPPHRPGQGKGWVWVYT